MAENKAELEKPAGNNDIQKAAEPTVHVIPAEFYGAASKKRVISASERASIEQATASGAPSQKVEAMQQPAGEKKKGGKGVIIAVVAVIVLLAGGGAAYFFLFAGEPKPSVPTGPSCGDSTCSPGESYMSCPVDCEPPPSVCGNGVCEDGENADGCAADCAVAASVCGDGECTDSETASSCPGDCAPPEPVCGDGECDEETEDHINCSEDCRPPDPVAGPDLDSDGLTDREEREIYGTDVGKTDTDNDSYIDLNEILNLFDPARHVPALLKDSPGIVRYDNDGMGYSLLRPAAWSVSERTGGRTVFTAQEGEYVEVNVEPKDVQRTLTDWYLGKNPELSSSQVTVLESKSGHEAIQSPDKLTSYINAGDRVIILRYDLGRDRMMQYRSTFFMMVQSLQVTETAISEEMMEAISTASGTEAMSSADTATAGESMDAMTEDGQGSSSVESGTEAASGEPAAPTPTVVVPEGAATDSAPPSVQ